MCIFFLACLLSLTPILHAAPPRPPNPPPVISASAIQDVQVPAVTPAMRRYSRTRYALYFIGTAYGLLALWGVLASGLSARLRTVAEDLHRARFWTLLIYYALLTLALAIIEFPLAFYSGYWLEHAYGLSGQSFTGWLWDRTEGEAVGLAINVAAVLAVVLAHRQVAAPLGVVAVGGVHPDPRLRHLSGAGADRAAVQQVHAPPARPAADPNSRPRCAGGHPQCADLRFRRQPPHQHDQRLCHGHRPVGAHCPLGHDFEADAGGRDRGDGRA